ncbi:NAD(P)/FAD-dependent oxidoreductase [Candidatus Palauibacter sp.]|uniref:NAD(P)/FAD-dependent oxidoreductase n=1 Tax=Candidatus Palauibacter sp. TaxID=3101350 RepID=UPI003B01FD55
MKTADAVVIGGGIMGASAAHFLARKGFGRVVLLERGRLAGVSTGHSAAIVRTYYSNPITLELAKRALHMFENDRELLGGDCGFRPIGFLLLIGERLRAAAEHILESERRHGLHVEDLSPGDVGKLAPQLCLNRVVRGILEPRSGYADPTRTTENLVAAARPWGLEPRAGVGATGVRLRGDRVVAVESEQGTIETNVVVNAAGPWAGRVGSWLGLGYSLRWSRESDLFVEMPAGFGGLPVVSDPGLRFYLRPCGEDRIIVGLGAPKDIEPVDPDDCDSGLDPGMRERIERPLFERTPALANARHLGGYASIYTITDDWHPIVGPEPGIEGYYAFLGGSGHGFKLGPPIGEALADVICGETPAIDLSPFRPGRFIDGEPLISAWGEGNRG